MNPVTLVNTVVARKSAVQPGSRCDLNMPPRTTTPEKIPSRLTTTCTAVNVEIDRPTIMVHLLSRFDEGEQILVDLVLMGRAQAVRCTLVDLEGGVLDQFRGQHGRGADRHDLVVVTM